ncbi:hypothetical protein [Microbacterium sp. bgisy189]|uniref:hypothetical protein n=1 Tax=Microbacterium sp. bgisy189 TaxID=3413798 RepID=UPI003EB8FB19
MATATVPLPRSDRLPREVSAPVAALLAIAGNIVLVGVAFVALAVVPLAAALAFAPALLARF